MNEATFRQYLEAYNRGDFSSVSRYYTDDIVFESYGHRRVGPEVRKFLEQLHQSGIKDRIVPRHIAVQGDRVQLDAETEITAAVDAPHLPFGPMKAGESRVVPMKVVYETIGDRIRAVKVT
jgi:ketosteroid isomerase-like protein